MIWPWFFWTGYHSKPWHLSTLKYQVYSTLILCLLIWYHGNIMVFSEAHEHSTHSVLHQAFKAQRYYHLTPSLNHGTTNVISIRETGPVSNPLRSQSQATYLPFMLWTHMVWTRLWPHGCPCMVSWEGAVMALRRRWLSLNEWHQRQQR